MQMMEMKSQYRLMKHEVKTTLEQAAPLREENESLQQKCTEMTLKLRKMEVKRDNDDRQLASEKAIVVKLRN